MRRLLDDWADSIHGRTANRTQLIYNGLYVVPVLLPEQQRD